MMSIQIFDSKNGDRLCVERVMGKKYQGVCKNNEHSNICMECCVYCGDPDKKVLFSKS